MGYTGELDLKWNLLEVQGSTAVLILLFGIKLEANRELTLSSTFQNFLEAWMVAWMKHLADLTNYEEWDDPDVLLMTFSEFRFEQTSCCADRDILVLLEDLVHV